MNFRPVATLIFTLLAPLASAAPPAALYISPSGDDKNPGTLELPFKSITRARDAVRKGGYNRAMQKDFVVYLRGGRYELTDTLYFDARDSGSNGHSVVYQAYEKEQPVISGGLKVTDWKPVADKPYFVASVPQRKPVKSTNLIKDNRSRALNPAYYQVQDLSDEGFAPYFRQLYVNGVRAEIARSNEVRASSRKEWWDDTTCGSMA